MTDNRIDDSYSGAAQIPSHPRTLPSTIRRADDTRKLARQAKLERKAEKRAAFEEETKRMKNQKRREIVERLRELGLEGKGVEELMEGDWDEGGWDRKMNELMAQEVSFRLFVRIRFYSPLY